MHRERHTLNSRAAHTHSVAQLVEKCTSDCLPRVRRVNQCLDHTMQRETDINQRRSSGQSIKRNWTVIVVAAVVGCCCWRWCVLWQLCCLCVASAFVVLLTYNSFFWLRMLYSYLSVSCGSMHRKSRAPPECAHSASHVCHKLHTDRHTHTSRYGVAGIELGSEQNVR